MKRSLKAKLLITFAFALVMVSSAQAVQISAGWTESDLGLENRGNGFYAGVQNSWPLGNDFDFTAAGEYQNKSASQLLDYTNPDEGLFSSEGEITLHCFQPAFFVGYSIPMDSFRPRLYVGGSILLKLNESWNEPEGSDSGLRLYYDDFDIQLHAGFSLQYNRFLLDARYSAGLFEMLSVESSQLETSVSGPQKAEIPELPEDGTKINSIQVGIGYTF